MSVEKINSLIAETSEFSLEQTLFFLENKFEGKVCFSTSFGQEDQVITDIIAKNDLAISIFTLDTGRLFQETYDVFEKTLIKYNKKIDVYFPNANDVENMLTEKGPNSFYASVENRKECCNIRKVAPLKKALLGKKIWITGLRAEQSDNRNGMQTFEYDSTFDIIKYNSLLKWSLEEVENYLNKNAVPQNTLHKKGFVSIGCAPCTRAIEEGEDIRAGRWWWETSHKECGLHQK
jgi:phosphoadenosine phosphosulfate reductase